MPGLCRPPSYSVCTSEPQPQVQAHCTGISQPLSVPAASACSSVCPTPHLPGGSGCPSQDSGIPQEPTFLLPPAPRGSASAAGGCWGPLFLLGLAQDTVTFEVAEAPVPSILKQILLEEPSSSTQGTQQPDRPQPSLAAVRWLQRCLESFWSLELGPKEYAYLKGTILFNPDVPGLHASCHIAHLQQEAHWALCEVLEPWYPVSQGRLARILLMASTLKNIPCSLLVDLFFRPIIGDVDITELLEDMLLLR